MPTLPNDIPKKEKGYHIRNFDPKARRLAKAGAAVAGVPIGAWISQAVKEKFARTSVKEVIANEEGRDSAARHYQPVNENEGR